MFSDAVMRNESASSIRENEIYKFQFMPSDLQNIYTEILSDCTAENVFEAFSQYLVENIEPIGWKGLWIPSNDNEEFRENIGFIVKVLNVSRDLDTSVLILRQINLQEDFIDSINDFDDEFDEHHQERIVSLRELFVFSYDDRENLFHKTAFLIEIVRFFYDNIWRPWDDLDENNLNEDYLTNRVVPRLNLIYAIKNNLISERFINRYEKILVESNNTRKKMNELKEKADVQNGQEVDSNGTSTEYINEIDALEYIKLKFQLQDYQREMSIIEDSHLRNIYDTVAKSQNDDDFDDGNQNIRSLHLVSPDDFNYKSLSSTLVSLRRFLDNEKSKWPIKLCNSLTKAINCCRPGDSIFLASGSYGQTLSWIEKDIEICGIDPDVEILSNTDSGDIFWFLNVPNQIRLCNLKIKATHPLDQLILIKSGHLILENCLLDCNHLLSKDPIQLLNGAKLTEIKTKIIGQ